MKPAIVAVGYNRINALRRLLNSIENAVYPCDDIPLIISLDKAPNEEDVAAMAESFHWSHGEKIIRRFPERQGLRKHILQCGDLSEKYGAVIILEDDLIVSPGFYTYTTEALSYYENAEPVTGIALYSHEWNGYARKFFTPLADQYDTYFGQYSITWGQCWTQRWWTGFKQWYLAHEDKLEWNDRIPAGINKWSDRSWGKYFVNYIVEQGKYYVIPRLALSTNCSDVGEHVTIPDNGHQVRLLWDNKENYRFAPADKAIRYDIFFENMDLSQYLPDHIAAEDLCVDLAGYGRKPSGRYLLSTLELPYQAVCSYGLQLRPYEMNVIMQIPGNEIFLYDTQASAPQPKQNKHNVMRYETRCLNVRDLLPYSLFLLKESITRKIKRK